MYTFTQSTTAELAKTLQTFPTLQLAGHTVENLEHQHAIMELLQTFNPGVQNSFFAGGVQALEACCTAEGYARMQKKYKGWREAAIKELNLVLCDFLSFTLLPNEGEVGALSAVAYTFEKWVFVYENGEQKPTRGSVDRYILNYENGQWKIDSVATYASEA